MRTESSMSLVAISRRCGLKRSVKWLSRRLVVDTCKGFDADEGVSLRGANRGSQGIEEVSWVFPEPEPNGANAFGSDVWVDVSVSMDEYAGHYKFK